MSKRTIGLVLLLVGSLAIGYAAGQRFFSIFDGTVPKGSMTDLVRAGAHAAYVTAGLVFGAVIFVWTVIAVVLARFFPAATKVGPAA